MIASSTNPSPETVAAHYDSLDRFYRDIWGEHVHHGLWESGKETPEEAVLHLSHRMAELAEIKAGTRVCDIGCGYGGTSRLLAREYGAKVSAFTLSTQQYNYALDNKLPSDKTEFFHQDFLRNKLPRGRFQAIISIECIEHIQDKKELFRQAFDLLEPGGKIALCVWAEGDKATPWQKKHLLQPICDEGRLPDLIKGSEFKDLMTEAGFVMTHEHEVGRKVKKTWAICCKRLVGKLATDASYRQFLRNSSAKDRVFALTLFRLLAAFETRAMSYWILAAQKPSLL